MLELPTLKLCILENFLPFLLLILSPMASSKMATLTGFDGWTFLIPQSLSNSWWLVGLELHWTYL